MFHLPNASSSWRHSASAYCKRAPDGLLQGVVEQLEEGPADDADHLALDLGAGTVEAQTHPGRVRDQLPQRPAPAAADGVQTGVYAATPAEEPIPQPVDVESHQTEDAPKSHRLEGRSGLGQEFVVRELADRVRQWWWNSAS